MPLIIDGWNFIRNGASDIDADDALESARTLIAYLGKYQHTHNDPIIVVFDSSREFLDIDYANTPKLKVVPSRNADAYIKGYLDKTPERQRKNIRVVSSDKSVYYYARSSFATPLRSEEFWEKLNGDA